MPALEAGRRPPLLDGFAAFLRAAPVEPSAVADPDGTPPAAQLLAGIPQLEQEALAAIWKPPLEPMAGASPARCTSTPPAGIWRTGQPSWQVTGDIGEPLRCRLDGREIEPVDEVMRLAEGTRSAAAWVVRASDLGIAGLSLERRG
jgi:hypothetical protein